MLIDFFFLIVKLIFLYFFNLFVIVYNNWLILLCVIVEIGIIGIFLLIFFLNKFKLFCDLGKFILLVIMIWGLFFKCCLYVVNFWLMIL